MDKFHDGIIAAIKDASPSVRRFIINLPEHIEFDFLPGQFVMLDLPIAHEFTTRSYSIASAPSNKQVELCIVYKPDGAGTDYLFTLKEGDHVKISAPQGRFFLKEPLLEDICMVCTGTGIAPFRSMWQYIFEKQIPHRGLYLIFGCRKEEDLLYRDEIEALVKEHPEFHYLPVLSRADESWQGRRGYVHPLYLELFKDKPSAQFYLCGWTNMVREAKNNLKEIGYSRKEINFELYD